ncbi:MAG: NAD-dependent epimerase/dehydratase family protein [Candidatus Methanoperedens sp.]|nr:NAD-dependent epimerase/dehydratase family protein [Candidatus Methanoperedens sp.]
MTFWEEKNVLVTGGVGFVGSHVVEMLVGKGANVTVVDNFENGSLNNLKSCRKSIELIKGDLTDPGICMQASKSRDVVLNIAARVGGIEYNRKHPGTMFTANILINTQMLEAARKNSVDRYLCVSSACVYPRYCTIPTPELEGFKDVPEETNLGYGWAKRMAEVQAQCYAEEYGMKIAIVRPYNAYGPRDHFDPEKSHVIPAIIKRIFDGEDPLVVWGNGEQTRAFLYVTDFARGLIEAAEKYPAADPVNLGTDEEVKIRDLVEMIIKLSGKKTDIFFDTSMPAGQPRRNCDTAKAKEKIGFEAKVKLKDGLKETIRWYKGEHAEK